jgi:hypothetical protein
VSENNRFSGPQLTNVANLSIQGPAYVMPHSANLKALIDSEVKGRILPQGPVVTLSEPDWDETVLDFSDPEFIACSQIGEDGTTHTVMLSQRMVSQLRPYLLRWITANSTD